MDAFRGEKVKRHQQGQTVVEYILLLAVSASLVLTLYRSDTFKKIFGPQGTLGVKIKSQSEWGYRHAYQDPLASGNEPDQYTQAASHPSYYNQSSGEGRFFGPRDSYP